MKLSPHRRIGLLSAIALSVVGAGSSARSEDARLIAVNPPGADIPGISQAMIVESGRVMYLSGHVPFGSGGALGATLEEQLDQVFSNMKATLAAAGADFSALARVTYFVRDYDAGKLETLRAVRDRWIGGGTPPASALIGVAALFHPDVLVEVDAVAVLPE